MALYKINSVCIGQGEICVRVEKCTEKEKSLNVFEHSMARSIIYKGNTNKIENIPITKS